MFSNPVVEILYSALRQFFLFAALLYPIELLIPAHADQRIMRRGLRTDLLYFFLTPLFLSAAFVLILPGMDTGVRALVPRPVLDLLRRQPFGVRVVEAILSAELLGYAVHRLCHSVPWLWRFHRVHHSSTALDFVATHRQHPFEALLLLTVANLSLPLLGLRSESLLLLVLFQKFHTALVHGNVRLDFGWATMLIASPLFHHRHHDADDAAPGHNYASMIPLIDWFFGTYSAPGVSFPRRYGIDESVPSGFWAQLWSPLRP